MKEKNLLEESRVCDVCRESSKKLTGCWGKVGENGASVSGSIYACDNETCTIAKRRREQAREEEQKRAATREENRRNGVDIERFQELRVYSGLRFLDLSKMAERPPSVISAWLNEREPFPKELYESLLAFLEQNCQEKTGRRFHRLPSDAG